MAPSELEPDFNPRALHGNRQVLGVGLLPEIVVACHCTLLSFDVYRPLGPACRSARPLAVSPASFVVSLQLSVRVGANPKGHAYLLGENAVLVTLYDAPGMRNQYVWVGAPAMCDE